MRMPVQQQAAAFFLSKLLMHFSCTWPFSKGMHVLSKNIVVLFQG
jgi:hypothetical protein